MKSLLILPLILLVSCAPIPEPELDIPAVVQKSDLNKPSSVTVRNLTEKDIVMGLRGPETKTFTIPAASKITLTIPAGKYTWAATAKNTDVKKGTKTFTPGSKYLWDLSLK